MHQHPIAHFVAANGIRVRSLEWPVPYHFGVNPAATSVLLLHGLTSIAETWSFVAPALAAEGFRVLAADLRGHGDSDKPDAGYSFANISKDLAGMVERLGVQRAIVVGQSWGAGVAAEFAAQFPDAVSHLVLVDGGFWRDGPPPEEPTAERLEQMLAPAEIYATVESYLDACYESLPQAYQRTTEMTSIYLSGIYYNPDGSVREKLHRAHQKLIGREMLTADARERFSRIACPVLFLPAENTNPRAAQRMAEKRERVEESARMLRTAAVRWVPDTVHDIQLHKPHEVAAAIRELAAGE